MDPGGGLPGPGDCDNPSNVCRGLGAEFLWRKLCGSGGGTGGDGGSGDDDQDDDGSGSGGSSDPPPANPRPNFGFLFTNPSPNIACLAERRAKDRDPEQDLDDTPFFCG